MSIQGPVVKGQEIIGNPPPRGALADFSRPQPTTEADEANLSVPLSAVTDFLTSIGFPPDATRRCRRIRIEPGVVQVTLIRLDSAGHYFIDETTGRVAEMHYVMPVVVK